MFSMRPKCVPAATVVLGLAVPGAPVPAQPAFEWSRSFGAEP